MRPRPERYKKSPRRKSQAVLLSALSTHLLFDPPLALPVVTSINIFRFRSTLAVAENPPPLNKSPRTRWLHPSCAGRRSLRDIHLYTG